ncbi:MAG: hypothetical protein AAF717_05450 [Bacteroidota bacterium]
MRRSKFTRNPALNQNIGKWDVIKLITIQIVVTGLRPLMEISRIGQ